MSAASRTGAGAVATNAISTRPSFRRRARRSRCRCSALVSSSSRRTRSCLKSRRCRTTGRAYRRRSHVAEITDLAWQRSACRPRGCWTYGRGWFGNKKGWCDVKTKYAVKVARARTYLRHVHNVSVPRARSGRVVLAAARAGRLKEKALKLKQEGWV